jgi:teichuronic acid biosynthesis glycosyltransferase TuaG
MKVNFKVSIITATYNSELEIIKTYEAIKQQTFTDWEWLVTDDCSKDNTLKILKEIAVSDERVKVFENVINSGAAVSRNNSLNLANGEYIAFIDSDDLWAPSKLEKQLNFMSNGVDFSFTAYDLIDINGAPLNKTVDLNNDTAFNYEDMLKKKATLGCSTVMVRRNAFIDINMPLLRTGQDYATWLKLLKTGKKAHLLNEVLTSYRIMPNSISRNKIKKAKRQWQIYRKVEKLSFTKSIVCFLFYAWRAVFRK